MKNSAYRDEISVMPLVDAMFGPSWMSWEEDLIFLSEVPGKSVIISNSSNAYGAAAIMDKEVMKKIADVFGEDLYIIPLLYCQKSIYHPTSDLPEIPFHGLPHIPSLVILLM